MLSPTSDHATPAAGPAPTDRLFVTWQDHESREIRPVGLLCRAQRPEGECFEFRYLVAARHAPFEPFVSLPELDQVYVSDGLFPLFSNRVMRPNRPDYAEYLDRLALPSEATPFEILAASNGQRETDTVEVFQEPQVDCDTGRATCDFLARGVRHVDGAADVIAELDRGDRMRLVREPENPVDRRALRIETADGRAVGFVPAYLIDFLHRAEELGAAIDETELTVSHRNAAGAWHLRLQCQMVTTMSPGAFMVGDLLPIVPFDEPKVAAES